MKIKQLKLLVKNPKACADFYCDAFNLNNNKYESSNAIRFGWTELQFEETEEENLYHYCFIIPNNQFENAFSWAKERLDLIEIENGRYTQFFDDWNAESFYFFDGAGNLAEFIVHRDLDNNIVGNFQASMILGISEIGLPTHDIAGTDDKLSKILGSKFWKGDKRRFGTHGSQEGKFLLPNPSVKNTWFPSEQTIRMAPFHALVEVGTKEVNIFFDGKNLKFQTMSAN